MTHLWDRISPCPLHVDRPFSCPLLPSSAASLWPRCHFIELWLWSHIPISGYEAAIVQHYAKLSSTILIASGRAGNSEAVGLLAALELA